MSIKRYADKLGPASIRLAGLQIWVHRRHFPEANDYWDGNWLNVTAHCGAQGAEVWAQGPLIHLPDLARWAEACEKMSLRLSREADLAGLEPALSVELSLHTLEQISMSVWITPDHLAQEHTFEFELAPSSLPDLIKDCRKVLADYPIKEDQERPPG